MVSHLTVGEATMRVRVYSQTARCFVCFVSFLCVCVCVDFLRKSSCCSSSSKFSAWYIPTDVLHICWSLIFMDLLRLVRSSRGGQSSLMVLCPTKLCIKQGCILLPQMSTCIDIVMVKLCLITPAVFVLTSCSCLLCGRTQMCLVLNL